jgi:hypothetical protein
MFAVDPEVRRAEAARRARVYRRSLSEEQRARERVKSALRKPRWEASLGEERRAALLERRARQARERRAARKAADGLPEAVP